MMVKHKNTTHGLSRSREYSCWSSMRQRCTDPRNGSYKNYGAKGVKVCKRWMKFANFIEDMGMAPSKKHSIDRKDNTKGYYPGNCRWGSKLQQVENRCTSRLLTYKGKTKPLVRWAKIYGISRNLLYSRIQAGWSVKRALKTKTLSFTDCGKIAAKKRWRDE